MREGRLNRLREIAETLEVEALLITTLTSVRYASGFSGSNGAALVASDFQVFATDGRYVNQAATECAGFEVLQERDLPGALLALAAERGLRRVAVELSALTAATAAQLAEAAGGRNLLLIDIGDALAEARSIKDADEISALTRACDITVQGFALLLSEGVLGRTELELAGRLEYHFRALGAEDRAFPSIVATGAHSSSPHHSPTTRVVASGDLVKFDCGARVEGYHADFTRTISCGSPEAWQLDLHEAVQAAQERARIAVAPGIGSIELDTLARQELAQRGFADAFVHPLGHGVGLDIHEYPILGRHDAILRPRMAVTIEPGAYLPGLGGVRIEDTVLVTDAGHAVLTEYDRGLIEV